MEEFVANLSPLTKFALAIGLAVILPKAMERLKLPSVLGFIVVGVLIGPNAMGMIPAEGAVVTLLSRSEERRVGKEC